MPEIGVGYGEDHSRETTQLPPREIAGAQIGKKKEAVEKIAYQKMQSGIELSSELAEGAVQEKSPAEKQAEKESAMAERKKRQQMALEKATRQAEADEIKRAEVRKKAEQQANLKDVNYLLKLRAAIFEGRADQDQKELWEQLREVYASSKRGETVDLNLYSAANKVFNLGASPRIEEPVSEKPKEKGFFSKLLRRG